MRNIPRILPADCQAYLYKKSWRPHSIFELIQEEGNMDEEEMFKVFNMGIGMVLIIPPQEEKPIVESLSRQNEEVRIIGKVVKGKRKVEMLG